LTPFSQPPHPNISGGAMLSIVKSTRPPCEIEALQSKSCPCTCLHTVHPVVNHSPSCPSSEESFINRLKYTMIWGTYGKGGVEHCQGTCPEHQLRWVRLMDCASDHLIKILITQYHITPLYRAVIGAILMDRKFGVGISEESLGLTREGNGSN
jgi:hypothetical protein